MKGKNKPIRSPKGSKCSSMEIFPQVSQRPEGKEHVKNMVMLCESYNEPCRSPRSDCSDTSYLSALAAVAAATAFSRKRLMTRKSTRRGERDVGGNFDEVHDMKVPSETEKIKNDHHTGLEPDTRKAYSDVRPSKRQRKRREFFVAEPATSDNKKWKR